MADGIIERYAIGGAVGPTFYLEPVATLEVIRAACVGEFGLAVAESGFMNSAVESGERAATQVMALLGLRGLRAA